ncbi:hypothetical protein GW17_00035641 [Ensete ventricosum]|nr:hypothetical protein GW17_00035641 [Ensete ventricosum]
MTGREARCTVPSGVAQSPSNLKDQKGSYNSRARTTYDMLLHDTDSHRRTPVTLNILTEDPVKRDDEGTAGRRLANIKATPGESARGRRKRENRSRNPTTERGRRPLAAVTSRAELPPPAFPELHVPLS